MQCNLDVHTAKEGPILRSNTGVTLVLSLHLRTTMLHLNSGQPRECCKRNFHRHFPKGSDLNNNTGLQQRHLNCALSAGTSSAAAQGDLECLGSTAQTFPLQDQCSSVPEREQQRSFPLLCTLLKGNPPDFKSFITTPSSSSKETNANIRPNTSTNFSDEHCRSQQVKSSLAALNCGLTRTQNLDHSGRTHSTPHEQVFPPSLSPQLSTDKVSTLGEIEPPTDDQIQDFIAKKLVYFRTILTQKNNYGHAHSNKGWNFCTNDRDLTLPSDCIIPKANSVAHLHSTSTSDKEDVIQQCTAAVGQALQKDSSNADLSLKSKHSTEYPQIMMKVAAACTKTEDESPVVLTALSRVTLDELTEKHPSLTLNCSSSQEKNKPLWLNINKNLDDTDQVVGVSWELKDMTEKQKGDAVEAGGLDNVQGVTDVSEDLQTKSSSVVSENKAFQFASLLENQDANTKIRDQQLCSVTCEDVIAHATLNSSFDRIQIHNLVSNQSEGLCNKTSREGVREDAGFVFSHTNLNKVKEQTSLSEGEVKDALTVNILKAPVYEDISDDEDMSQLPRKLLDSTHEELSLPARFKDPEYEDISEDEMPQMSVERPSLTQVPEQNHMQSPFENKGYGYVQGQAQMKTEIVSDEELTSKKQVSPKAQTLDIAQHCSCPCSVETDDEFEGLLCPKCDNKRHLGWQTNHCVSCSPSSVLKDEDETDDQMDDYWIVIPISVSDLKFEPEDEDQDGPVLLDDGETGDKERKDETSPTHCELHWPAPKPVAASASEIDVFDTIESFLHANARKSKMDSGREPHTPQNTRASYSEPEDSCETEDSCDYSSGSEHNYLTVSRQLLKKRSAPLPPETNDSMSEKEGEDNEITNVQKSQTRSLDKLGCMQKLRQLIEAKAASNQVQPKTEGQKIAKNDYIIILDSDTEDEGDQNYKKKTNRKRLFSSCSEDSGDAPCSQQKRHSPEAADSEYETAKAKLQETRLSSADSSLPQHQSKLHHTEFKEGMQDAGSDLSHGTEKSGQLIETKAGSMHVRKKTNKREISKNESVIILDSDTEDEGDQNYKKKTNRKRLFSSCSEDSGDAPCSQQKRHSPEAAKAKLQETRLSSADSSLPQHQSKLHHTEFKEGMQDAGSDLSHGTEKSGQLIETKAGSTHVRKKTNRQTTSKRIVVHDSDKVFKENFSKKKAKTKNIHSRSEDSGDSLFATQNKPTETMDHLCGTANEKPEKNTLSSKGLPEKQPQSADSTSNPDPVIPRLVVQKSSQPKDYLTLLKDSRVHRQEQDETWAPTTSAATRKQTDSPEMHRRHLHRNKKGRFVSKPKLANDKHHATKNKVQANVTKPRLVSRPSQEGPSTSTSSLSSTSGKLSEARQSLASSRGLSQSGEPFASSSLPKSKQSTSIPRLHLSSSELQRSHSYSSPSTLDHPYTPTIGPSYSATMQSSARKQVTNDWQQSFFPIRRDRKTSLEEDLRTTNHNSWREGRPGPSHYDRATRQRHNSHESATRLMKKTKSDAIQWTKAISRDAPREQRCSVGDGYKWSEKPTVAKPTKGSGREGKKCSSPPSLHL
ncbi:uncharacterized protein LOC122871160 isoform X2 [Siniperca chuatsi]|uniref:uncharacterized protein LOC122871160 isoform X2 n=1 Tax=Siniperca chuatsi TaxID=119488 RepID=UPI001CE1A8C6|nr:uncharacterized protein LOC122871160 isoform X2 [Siniperca chuatsi]